MNRSQFLFIIQFNLSQLYLYSLALFHTPASPSAPSRDKLWCSVVHGTAVYPSCSHRAAPTSQFVSRQSVHLCRLTKLQVDCGNSISCISERDLADMYACLSMLFQIIRKGSNPQRTLHMLNVVWVKCPSIPFSSRISPMYRSRAWPIAVSITSLCIRWGNFCNSTWFLCNFNFVSAESTKPLLIDQFENCLSVLQFTK